MSQAHVFPSYFFYFSCCTSNDLPDTLQVMMVVAGSYLIFSALVLFRHYSGTKPRIEVYFEGNLLGAIA